jgi:hypothetical protein
MALFKCGTCRAVYADYYPLDDICIKCRMGHIRIITRQGEEITMTAIIPTIRRMTFEEANQAGLHLRGLMLKHQGQSYRLNAGTSDTVHIFRESIYLYVLTINSSLGYIGFDSYMPMEPDPINTIFFHSEKDMKDVFGARWKQLSPRTMALRLTNYLI